MTLSVFPEGSSLGGRFLVGLYCGSVLLFLSDFIREQ